MGIFGYTSLKDFFDGGGPGASRDTSKDNKTSNSKTSKAVKSAAKKIVGGIGDFAGGIKNDISMGFNPETRDQDYYRRTMDTINRTRGLEAAQAYYDRMPRDRFGNVSAPNEQLAPRIGGHPGGSISGGGYVPPEVGDDTGPVDDDGNPVDDDGNPIEEEIEYTYMPPFFGGYQPATRADTLVPERGGLGSFLPNPRLDPIFPQQPPPDFDYYIDDGPGYGKTYPPGFERDVAIPYTRGGSPPGFYENQGTNLPAGDLMNDPNYRGDGTNFGMIENNSLTGLPQTAPVNNGGQFSSLAELDDFQQQNPSLNLMTEYQRLRALEGGTPAAAQLPPRGVASLFGNEQAPRSMYQGIMS